MGTTNHFILKHILDIEHDSSTASDTLAERLSQLCQGSLAALIERVLGQFDQPGKLIRLDRVSVDLDCHDLEEIEELLAARLPIEMEFALRDALADPENVEVAPEEKGSFETAVFYLEKGYLPWNANTQITQTELEFRLTEALYASPSDARRFLRILLDDPRKLRRFVLCFSHTMRWRLADMIWPGVKEEWNRLSLSTGVEASDSLPFWEVFYRKLKSGAKDVEEVVARIKEAPADVVEETSVPEEGIFVQNAGAVLLHPFLQPLFEELGAAKGDAVIQPEKAIQILHYAVTGRQTAEEWELPLLKLLCGIPFEEVIQFDKEFTAPETAEVEKMLTSLIKHWDVLKNTGIDGLQESFLQREGRISRGQTNWTLRVQQKGIDVLVGHLPWSIGFIKLPWMEHPLVTEWS